MAASILNALLGRPPQTSDLPALPAVHPTLLSQSPERPLPVARLFFACALTSYRNITYVDAKGKTHPLAEAVLREGLKLGVQNHYLDGIPALFSAAALLQPAVTHYASGESISDVHPERVAIGM